MALISPNTVSNETRRTVIASESRNLNTGKRFQRLNNLSIPCRRGAYASDSATDDVRFQCSVFPIFVRAPHQQLNKFSINDNTAEITRMRSRDFQEISEHRVERDSDIRDLAPSLIVSNCGLDSLTSAKKETQSERNKLIYLLTKVKMVRKLTVFSSVVPYLAAQWNVNWDFVFICVEIYCVDYIEPAIWGIYILTSWKKTLTEWNRLHGKNWVTVSVCAAVVVHAK